MNNTPLWMTIITTLFGGGLFLGFFTWLGSRGKNRVDANGQLIAGWQKQVDTYEKQATLATQQTNALRLELHEMKGNFEAKIIALEKSGEDKDVKIEANDRRIWMLERELEDYKRCSSTSCPFRVLRLSNTPG